MGREQEKGTDAEEGVTFLTIYHYSQSIWFAFSICNSQIMVWNVPADDTFLNMTQSVIISIFFKGNIKHLYAYPILIN